MKFLPILLAVFLVVSGCSGPRPVIEPTSIEEILPHAEREFRGVWVATVANIDWPSKPGLSAAEQQQEAITILDTIVALHMNAVILQVRPHCDALYKSAYEPWSYYLTGEQGKAPDPMYDPLQFWIEESHRRGIELHAWFNPYRAHLTMGADVTDSSIVRKRPELVKKINDSMYWLDPSLQATQDHTYDVVMDVVKRYDVDGVHFDDYFYPYNDGQFPDDDEWAIFQKQSRGLSREDWRRSHVNTFIERVYHGIKKEKRHVKFGLSPFGIWRPNYPSSISGYDQYNMLYADARLWLNNGWIDYFTPQLYWPVNRIRQSFPVLLGWWTKENTMQRHLWPGMIISRVRDERAADEIFNQIMITRGFDHEKPGHIHFSMRAFLRDSSALNTVLKTGPYQQEALAPSSSWLDNQPPKQPEYLVTIVTDTATVEWTHPEKNDVFHYVVYYRMNSEWSYSILPHGQDSLRIPLKRKVSIDPRNRTTNGAAEREESINAFSVTAVDRLGNESKPNIYLITPPIQ